ncbi:MAG TPA: hypothetical protein PLT66_05490, partial [Bacillota bacterium]|nr:hypothetical protein [Bacillota bacterium]
MKTIKKLLALLLAAAIALPLASCAQKVNVFEYKDVTIPTQMYSYILSENKSYILSYYELDDSAELWASAYSDDVTIGEWLVSNVNEYCKTLVIASAIAAEKGITVSEESLASYETLEKKCIDSYGGKAKWNVYLSTFGINIDIFREYMMMSYLLEDLYNALVKDGTISATNDDAYQLYCDEYEGYSLVRHILLCYKFQTKNDAGETVNMTDDEIEAKRTELQALVDKMISGEEQFDDYVDQNEDSGEYYFVTDDSTFVKEFQDAALEMDVGGYSLVKSTY